MSCPVSLSLFVAVLLSVGLSATAPIHVFFSGRFLLFFLCVSSPCPPVFSLSFIGRTLTVSLDVVLCASEVRLWVRCVLRCPRGGEGVGGLVVAKCFFGGFKEKESKQYIMNHSQHFFFSYTYVGVVSSTGYPQVSFPSFFSSVLASA